MVTIGQVLGMAATLSIGLSAHVWFERREVRVSVYPLCNLLRPALRIVRDWSFFPFVFPLSRNFVDLDPFLAGRSDAIIEWVETLTITDQEERVAENSLTYTGVYTAMAMLFSFCVCISLAIHFCFSVESMSGRGSFFADYHTVHLRAALAYQKGIRGIMFWKLGEQGTSSRLCHPSCSVLSGFFCLLVCLGCICPYLFHLLSLCFRPLLHLIPHISLFVSGRR